jgi:hypothetical protein
MFTFERMSSPVERPYGADGKSKYQGQHGPLPSGVWEELGDELEREQLRRGLQTDFLAKDGN